MIIAKNRKDPNLNRCGGTCYEETSTNENEPIASQTQSQIEPILAWTRLSFTQAKVMSKA